MEGSLNLNRYRGDVALTLPDGREVCLRLPMNVLAQLEDRLDAHGGDELSNLLLRKGPTVMRVVFHAVLTARPRQGAPVMPASTTLDDVGNILDDLGGMANGQPASICYWELMVAGNIANREKLVEAQLLPPGKETGSPRPADGQDEAAGAPPPGG